MCGGAIRCPDAAHREHVGRAAPGREVDVVVPAAPAVHAATEQVVHLELVVVAEPEAVGAGVDVDVAGLAVAARRC